MLNKKDKWLEFIDAATPEMSEHTRKFVHKQVSVIHDSEKSPDNRLRAAENVVFLLTGYMRTQADKQETADA